MKMFVDIFECIPIEKSRNKLITTGHCFDFNAAYKIPDFQCTLGLRDSDYANAMCVEMKYAFEEKAVDHGCLWLRVSVSISVITTTAFQDSNQALGVA